MKDIALMYEVWVFFKVVDEITRCAGEPVSASVVRHSNFEATVPWSYAVGWTNGVKAVYNQSFTRRVAHGFHSYSVGLRPDVIVDVPVGLPGCGRHVLDAKFKVSWGQRSTADLEAEEEAADDRTGSFVRADLHKMHAYRDSLAGVQSAWVVYPGNECRFFAAPGAGEGEISGVGVVPLRPSSSAHDLRTLIAKLTVSGAKKMHDVPGGVAEGEQSPGAPGA